MIGYYFKFSGCPYFWSLHNVFSYLLLWSCYPQYGHVRDKLLLVRAFKHPRISSSIIQNFLKKMQKTYERDAFNVVLNSGRSQVTRDMWWMHISEHSWWMIMLVRKGKLQVHPNEDLGRDGVSWHVVHPLWERQTEFGWDRQALHKFISHKLWVDPLNSKS